MSTRTRESISLALRFHILRRDKFTCQYCGAKAPDAALHVDHVEPVAAGGTNDPGNLIAACVRCNLGKSDGAASTVDVRPATYRERQLEKWLDSSARDEWTLDTVRSTAPAMRGWPADLRGAILAVIAEVYDIADDDVAALRRYRRGLEAVGVLRFNPNYSDLNVFVPRDGDHHRRAFYLREFSSVERGAFLPVHVVHG